jgi:hypothetical protein
VELAGVGTVRVRGLNRFEAMIVAPLKGIEMERRAVAFGLVDPELTESEVGQWQKAAPAGELQKVAAVIQRLSGLDEGADKSNVPKLRGKR